MTLFPEIELLSREQLLELVAELREQNRELQEEVIKLRKIMEQLRAESEQLKREQKRQAAPFSKGERVKRRRRPGRKTGQGVFRHREIPLPEEITEPPVEVDVTAVCA